MSSRSSSPIARKRVILTLALFTFPVIAFAQTATVQGRITDESGAVVPGAHVTAKNVSSGVEVSTSTNDQGAYNIPFLQPGAYTITVEKQGFKAGVRSNAQLAIDQTAGIDIVLSIGEASQRVEVQSSAELLQTQTALVGQDIDTKTVSTLPLNGRDYTQLVTLGAGAAPNSYSRAKNGFSLNGSQTFQNTVLLDGIDNNNYILGIDTGNVNALTPSVDAIQEFRVESGNYGAQYGRAAGGVVIASIKSGTNQFHGTLFEYLRNNVLDANDFFANRAGLRKPPLRRNQFGATLGGPVLRNRSFFFVSYQGERQTSSQSGVTTVPLPAMAQGNFSGLAPIYNPFAVSRGVRPQFPGNIVPPNLLDPAGLKLASLYPAPNLPGLVNNYGYNQPFVYNTDELDSRFDEQITQNDLAFVRYSRGITANNQGSVFPSPGNGGSGFGQYPLNQPIRAWSVALGETHILTPALVNEVHLGYTHLDSNQIGPETQPLFAQFGIKGIALPGLNGLPQITVAGYSSLGDRNFNPNPKLVQTGQLNDTLSWDRGNHNLKFGAEVLLTHDFAGTSNNARGSLNFSGQFTSQIPGTGSGSPIADLLLGQTSTAAISTPLIGRLRNRYYGVFVDDSWRLTPKLTLDLGLRYEVQTPLFERDNRMTNFDLDPNSATFGTLVPAVGGGIRQRAFSSLDTNNFAPRLGLAYRIDPKTVVRGAFGIFYGGLGYQDVAHSGVANPPGFLSVSAPSATNASISSLVVSNGYPPGILTLANLVNPNLFSVSRAFPMPATDAWNFSIERQLPANNVLTLSYVGNSTSHLMGDIDFNAPPPAPGAINPRRPFPKYGTIIDQSPYAHSTYHGLQATFQRRFTNGFSLLSTYTYSHALDNVLSNEDNVGGAVPQNPRNANAEKASSGFDITHKFVTSVIYNIPLGPLSVRTFERAIFGGWQLGGIFIAEGGHPLTLGTSPNPANTTTPERPNRICDGNLPSDQRTVDQWFQVSCYALPAPYTYGNASRGTVRSPGLINLDALVARNFAIRERISLEFRSEFFNLTNSAHFGSPGLTIGTALAGRITSDVSPNRQIQFALRLVF
ncbi:MAG TPA: TonB-dependent receptor [Bryobacteraceae bacterium]|nr:TonB-dependent receptor [Bryobacteraceae bacterium]